jgi:predicted restriction endonuclease
MNNETRIEQQAQTIFDILDTLDATTTLHIARDTATGRIVVRVAGYDCETGSETLETVTGRMSRDALAQACQVLVK